MGLVKTLVFLFFLIISTSGIQAEENGERRAELNGAQYSVHGDDSVIDALTVQNNNVYNTSPNDTSIYGSITKVETDIYDSPDSPQPSSTQIRTVVAPGGPGHQGATYITSKEHNQKGSIQNQIPDKRTGTNYIAETYSSGNTFDIEPGSEGVFGSYINLKDKVYRSKGGENHTQPNGSDNRTLRAITVLTNNHVQAIGGNMKINMGSMITYGGNDFPGTEQQTDAMDRWNYIPKNRSHILESKRKAGKPIDISDFEVNSQGEDEAQNNTESREHSTEDHASGSRASSPPSSSSEFSPYAQNGENVQNNTETEANSNIPNSANKKLNLSFQNLIMYFLIVLPSYYLF